MIFLYQKFKNLPTKWKLLSIFIIAFLTRLIANIIFQGINSPPDPSAGIDHIEYDLMAQNLAKGEGLALEILRRPPGVAFLLFPIYYFFGINYMLARILFCLLGAATCIVVFFIGRKLFDNKTGILAAFILCVYPMHIYYSMHFLSEVPWAFLMSIAMLCLLLFEQSNKMVYGALAGFFVGLNTFVRPTALLYLPFYALLTFISYFFKDKKKFFRLAFIPLLLMVLSIMPWMMRNHDLTGHFVFISTHGGRTFWSGNNEVVLENPKLIGSLTELTCLPEISQFLRYTNPYEQDMAAYGYGINFIKTHLKDILKLEVMKIYRLVTPFYNTPNRIFNVIGGLSWGLLSIFVLWGFIVTFGNARFNPLHSAVSLTLFIALLFYGDHRFREAISPVLAIYASLGINKLIRLVRG